MEKERVMISFPKQILKALDDKAEKVGVSRNALVVQIVRNYLGLPSLIEE